MAVKESAMAEAEGMSASGAEVPSPEAIMQLGLGFLASKTLLSAIELGLFTALSEQPLTLEKVQDRMCMHPRSTRDFLDALVALRFLERADGVYRNTAASDLFLDKRKATYVGGMLEMANRRLYPFWGHLTVALQTGKPQNEARDGSRPMFEVLYSDRARLREFLKAMTGISRGANRAIAERFPWANYRSFADVGAAQGDLAVQIAARNPHLRGVGFDLPQVKPVFEEYVEENGLANRLQFIEGSFFDDALPRAEVILMGHILHDWGLETKKMLVAKAYETVPEGGALVVYDAIIDDDRSQNAFGLLMSLNMAIETPEGFDYTGADCCRWMREAGFRETRVEHLLGPDSMVVGVK